MSVWPRIISAPGEQRNETASATSAGSTSRPAGVRARLPASICSRFGKWSSAPVSTTPPETAFTRIPCGRARPRDSDERLERRLRRSDQDVVLSTRTEPSDETATIVDPRHLRAAARASERKARAFAASVQSKRLSVVSSAGRITPVAAQWTSASSGPSAATSSATRARGDVAADEDRSAPSPAAPRRSPRPRRRSQVADRDPLGAVRRAPATSRSMPARAGPSRGCRRGDELAFFAGGRSARAGLGSAATRGARRLARGLVGLRRGVSEAVQQRRLLLGVRRTACPRGDPRQAPGRAHGSGRRSGGRRRDERVDLLDGRQQRSLHRQ